MKVLKIDKSNLEDKDIANVYESNNEVKKALENGKSVYLITEAPKVLLLLLANKYYGEVIDLGYTVPFYYNQMVDRLISKWRTIIAKKTNDLYGDVTSDEANRDYIQRNIDTLDSIYNGFNMVYITDDERLNALVSLMEKYIIDSDDNVFESNIAHILSAFINGLINTQTKINRGKNNREDFPLVPNKSKNANKELPYSGVKPLFSLFEMQRQGINFQITDIYADDYFIPPIIADDFDLVCMWQKDISSLKAIIPEGTMVSYRCDKRIDTIAYDVPIELKENVLKREK